MIVEIENSISTIELKIDSIKFANVAPKVENASAYFTFTKLQTSLKPAPTYSINNKLEDVMELKIGQPIEVLSYCYNDYYKVKVGNHKGYLHEINIHLTPEIRLLKIQKEIKGNVVDAKGFLNSLSKNTKTVTPTAIKVGMSKPMVKETIGPATEINRTTHEGGVWEQWIYERDQIDVGSKPKYLYFENERLKSIQEFKVNY